MLRDLGMASLVLVIAGVFGAQMLGARVQSNPEPIAAPQPAAAPAAPAPKAIAAGIAGEVVLKGDGRGHFMAELRANGIRFPAVVDTGASVVALPQSVGEKLGFFPSPNQFSRRVTTANGEIGAAPVMLPELSLGTIAVRNVEAVILPDASLKGTLLGMSFLSKLKGFTIEGERLTLKN
jgi:aspartyl protease family protein